MTQRLSSPEMQKWFLETAPQPPALAFDISDLYTRNAILREQAVARLVAIGEPAVAILAAVLLNQSGMETHLRTTVICADERIAAAREAAANALGRIGRPAIPALMKILRSEDAHARELAARALHDIGDPAIGPLTKALQSLDVNVRTHAAGALVGLNGEKSVESLRRLLYEELDMRRHLRRRWLATKVTRCAGLFALWFLLMTLLDGQNKHIAQFLMNPLFTVGILAGFADTGAGLRRNTVAALSSTDDVRLVGAFALCLADHDPAIRKAATDALKKLLPLVTAADATHITPQEMNALLSILAMGGDSDCEPDDVALICAVLKGLEQIGDARALPRVSVLAETWEANEIARAARECLPYLQERARQAKAAQTLLRPAGVGYEAELLRPAKQDAAHDARELLRAESSIAEEISVRH